MTPRKPKKPQDEICVCGFPKSRHIITPYRGSVKYGRCMDNMACDEFVNAKNESMEMEEVHLYPDPVNDKFE